MGSPREATRMNRTIVPPHQIQVRFSRKPRNSRAMLRELSGYHVDAERVWVIERITMTQAESRAFERDFFQPQRCIVPLNSRPAYCIVVEAPRMPTLYVKPEGYDYARYVGLPAGET